MIAAFTSAAFGVWLAAVSAAPAIFVNQVAYDLRGPKLALIQTDAAISGPATATVIDAAEPGATLGRWNGCGLR